MYYLILSLLIIQLLIKEKVPKNVMFGFSILLLALIAVFRYGVGADYFSYEFLYKQTSFLPLEDILSFNNKIEPGFNLLMYLSNKLHLSYQTFLGLINTLMLYMILKWLQENSLDFPMSVLLFYSMFYFVWVLSALRQGLVISIYLFLFYRNRKSFNFFQKFIIILLLSTLHQSALFLLLIEILGCIKWTKRSHLIFLLFALFLAIMPFDKIFVVFENVPVLNRMYFYIENFESTPLISPPSLMRFGFFILIYYFYDDDMDKFWKNVYDKALYGFSLYFVFKISELTAARLSIYTFFMFLIIAPKIIHEIDKKSLKSFSYLFLILFSVLYFNKETHSMIEQVGYQNPYKFIPYTNIYNKNSYNYDNYFYFLKNKSEQLDQDYIQFKNNFANTEMVTYNENDQYYKVNVTSSNQTLTFIVNNEGKWLMKPQYNPNLELYGNVLKKIDNYGMFGKTRYLDISHQNRSQQELKEAAKVYLFQSYDIDHQEEEVLDASYIDIPNSFSELFKYPENIKNVELSRFDLPFEYYIMKIDYYYLYNPSYIYLDEKHDAIVDIAFDTNQKFNKDGYATAYLDDYKIVFHKSGNVVWLDKERER